MYFAYRMLMCKREESRFGESILHSLFKPVDYLFPTLLSTHVTDLATALVNQAASPLDGTKVHTLSIKDIYSLAGHGKCKGASTVGVTAEDKKASTAGAAEEDKETSTAGAAEDK